MNTTTATAAPHTEDVQHDPTTLSILFALSLSHLLNDAIQALIPALYPLIKDSYHLSFTQIGLITLTFQMVGSVLQPVVGFYTDRHPKPFSLAFGMGATLLGLVVLALAPGYGSILAAAAMVGLGSAVFHPESSRMARLASGGRHGFAQSLFQVGGNAGTSLGPLLAAGIIVPHGQRHVLWFTFLALAGIVILTRVGRWYQRHLHERQARKAAPAQRPAHISQRTVTVALMVLLVLMFSKFFYLASMTNYYTFYLIHQFGLSVQAAQGYLFVFLAAVAVGTIAGGPIGDRFGRKFVIWVSILGMAPFSLWLPHAGLKLTTVLSAIIGLIMASAFPAILVFATELLPGNVGLIAGLFFGLAFGMAGIGSAILGKLADARGINFVVNACSFLPLLGLATALLPDLKRKG